MFHDERLFVCLTVHVGWADILWIHVKTAVSLLVLAGLENVRFGVSENENIPANDRIYRSMNLCLQHKPVIYQV
jgi:hypothetical protein